MVDIGLSLSSKDLVFVLSKDYKEQIVSVFKKLNQEILSTINKLHATGVILEPKKHESRLRDTIDLIIKIYDAQYAGDRLSCYNIFIKLMNHLIGEFSRPNIYVKLLKGNHFYRVRSSAVEEGKSKTSIFHIPFDKRYLVSNLRYNSPGIPCLYCGNTLSTACEEIPVDLKIYDKLVPSTHSDNILNFAVFKNSNEIACLDLSFREISSINSNDMLPYLMIYPLIFALHTKQKFPKKSKPKFRIEYLLPSLLMDWLFNQMEKGFTYFSNNVINSIKYSSVKSENLLNHFNYVFPAIYNPSEIHCQTLKDTFLRNHINLFSDDLYNRFGDIDIKGNISKIENYALSLL